MNKNKDKFQNYIIESKHISSLIYFAKLDMNSHCTEPMLQTQDRF
jgi:hypothetical protein